MHKLFEAQACGCERGEKLTVLSMEELTVREAEVRCVEFLV